MDRRFGQTLSVWRFFFACFNEFFSEPVLPDVFLSLGFMFLSHCLRDRKKDLNATRLLLSGAIVTFGGKGIRIPICIILLHDGVRF